MACGAEHCHVRRRHARRAACTLVGRVLPESQLGHCSHAIAAAESGARSAEGGGTMRVKTAAVQRSAAQHTSGDLLSAAGGAWRASSVAQQRAGGAPWSNRSPSMITIMILCPLCTCSVVFNRSWLPSGARNAVDCSGQGTRGAGQAHGRMRRDNNRHRRVPHTGTAQTCGGRPRTCMRMATTSSVVKMGSCRDPSFTVSMKKPANASASTKVATKGKWERARDSFTICEAAAPVAATAAAARVGRKLR